MKLLVFLSTLQMAALVFLAFKVMEPPGTTVAGAHSDPPMREERLREIVREELAASRVLVDAAPDARTADAQRAADTRPPRQAPAPVTLDQRVQGELVRDQLEHYKRQGHMSPAEMQEYYDQLGRLDPATRTEMLRNLVRAMNAGEIRGQL